MLQRSLFHRWRWKGAILAGIVVFTWAFRTFPPGSQPVAGQEEPGGFTNSFEGAPAAIAEGKVLYQRLCIFCHGAGGRGAKGPDLTDDFWRFGGRDGEVFATIAAGRPGTQMGAFAGRISSDEIWKIIAYLRSQYYGALAKAKDKGILTACTDPHNLPYSEKDPNPTGFDVDLAGEIAQHLGLRVQYFWVDTRKGLTRALGNSLLQKRCDFFLGVPSGKDTVAEHEGLVFTRPYFGTGYILAVQADGPDVRRLEDLKGMRTAVQMASAAEGYLLRRGYDRAPYRSEREALEAIQKGEVQVALLWAPDAGWWLKEHPDGRARLVEGYVPEPGLRWNVAIAVREADRDLKAAIDRILEKLMAEGHLKGILTKYGVPFYPSFD